MPHLLRTLSVVALLGLAAPAFGAGEMVDNPAYQAWAKYKPGTTVTTEMTTEMEGGNMPQGGAMPPMTSEMTQTLDKVTPDAVSISIEMKMGGPMAGMAPHKMATTIPAKIEKGKEDVPAMITMRNPNVEVKDVKTGSETIDVDGKKMETKTISMTVVDKERGSESQVEMWTNADVPGGQVKMKTEGTMSQGGMNMKMKMTSHLKSFKVVD